MKNKLLFKDELSRKNSVSKSMFTMLLLFFISCFISNAQVTTYPIPPNAVTSSVFQFSANGQSIPVYKYMDYHYAHFSLSGTANFKVTASSNITSSKISPLSLNIPGTISGNQLNFPLSQIATNDQTPLYLVIQINSLEKLVILADRPEVNVPASNGSGIYNVTASPYNADKTGVNYTQPAIQKAIDDASSAGGGTVYVPAGIYKIKENLSVKSNVTLYLAPGSVLKAIDIRSEYPQLATIEPLLIVATGANNATIRGRGEIDASGFKLMDPPTGFTSQSIEHPRRRIVQIDGNENVTFDGIMLKDASGWSMDLRSSNNVVCQNVKVLNHKNNNRKIENDGIDMTSSSNSKVNQCFVITIDDAMCAKARYEDMSNVEFSNNVNYSTAAGVKAGMQSVGNMTNIVFRNCDVINSRRGIGIDTKEGNLPISGVVFKDIRVEYSRDNCIEFMSSFADIKDIDIINCECQTDNRIDFFGAENIKNVNMRGLVLNGHAINSSADADIYADITSGPNDTYSFGPRVDDILGIKYEAEQASLTNGAINSGATGQYVDLEAGGKIQWTVNATAATNYNLAFNTGVGAASTRKMGVYVNGTKRGVITSSFIGYEESSIVAPLNQGSNVIELRDSEGTTELNVDYMKISKIVSRYEAENAEITNGTITSGASGQYVDVNAEGKLSWTIPTPLSSSYKLTFNAGVYSASTRKMGVYVNGTKVGVITSSAIGFENISITTSLNQGNNTVELRDSEGTTELNVDYLDIESNTQSTSKITKVDAESISDATNDTVYIYPNPNNGILNIELNGKEYNSLDIYTITGALVYSKKLNNESSLRIDLSTTLKSGTYLVSLKSNSSVSTKKLIVR